MSTTSRFAASARRISPIFSSTGNIWGCARSGHDAGLGFERARQLVGTRRAAAADDALQERNHVLDPAPDDQLRHTLRVAGTAPDELAGRDNAVRNLVIDDLRTGPLRLKALHVPYYTNFGALRPLVRSETTWENEM